MEVTRLKAERRTALGRNQIKQIRRQGWLPAVVYGGEGEPASIAVSEWEMEQHLRHHHRVYQIEMDGQQQSVYLQDVQWYAMTDRIQHVDFKRIDLTKEIEAEVEIEFVGHPAGASKGGALSKDYTALPVRCLPTSLPDSIEVSVAHLDLHQSVLAKEVQMPEGVTLLLDADEVVCHVAEMVEHAPADTTQGSVEPEIAGAPPKAEGEAKEPAEKADKAEKKEKE